MPRKKVVFDTDNPQWTRDDFRRARPASELPSEIRKAFPKTRGPQKAPKKIPVSIRLSPEVVDHFKATGPGWQSRIDNTLKKAVAKGNV
ncbi:MAG: BrnA antitoxin family protein [Hyphomicrobiales bacterium]